MSNQPEALRVADELSDLAEACSSEHWPLERVAARLLREQHDEIVQLRAHLSLDWKMICEQREEIERLRGALKGIETLKVTIDGVLASAYQTEGWMRELAREALEVKT